MATGAEAHVESVNPRAAPLRADSDLTLEEIEDTINSLVHRERAVKGDGTETGLVRATGPKGAHFDKGLAWEAKEVHHVDATSGARADVLPADDLSMSGDRTATHPSAVDGPNSRPRAGDKAHTLAPRPHLTPPDMGVLNLEEGPPSRAASPGLARSGKASRRSSSHGHLAQAAEIDHPAADVSSLNDSFTQQIMAGALKLKSSLFKPERISFQEVARNPALARRARAEMDNHQFKGVIESLNGEAFEGRPHDLEVARLQVALDVVEADAEEESKINSQLAQLVCIRLDASRRAVERLLGILQAVTTAEATYTRTMNAVSRVKLGSECDGPSLRGAVTRFSDVPWLVSEAHASVQNGLVEVTHRCQDLLGELRRECQSISHDSTRAHSAVLSARKGLHHAFSAHKAACRTADDVALECARSGKGPASIRLESDPWLTESRVLGAHRKLHTAQTYQRSLLASAYERVKDNELQRCEVFKDVSHTFLASYKNELGPDPAEEDSIRGVVNAVDCEQDLAQFTASAAAAVETGAELASRQTAALSSALQDLLCSPDIVRQGEMARWVKGAGKWSECHFILTRTGFMHWLTDSQQEATPLGSMNLSRCQFEAGEAPEFSLREQQSGLFGRGKRARFKAPTVEDSCDWAIALRESIASFR